MCGGGADGVGGDKVLLLSNNYLNILLANKNRCRKDKTLIIIQQVPRHIFPEHDTVVNNLMSVWKSPDTIIKATDRK